jgi:DDE superfamily endonuclease
VRDGKVLTHCAASRNSKGYIASLADIEADNPSGDIFVITDNLSSHSSLETRTWLEGHPRIHHVFIPTGACWLNLQEGWWRLFRRDAASRPKLCQSSGDRASHPSRDRSTQSASQTLGVGTAAQDTSSLSASLLLSPLTNAALGNDYEDGYDSAKYYNKQGGSSPASGDTIESIYQSVEQNECPERFYEGWRDREDDERTFWSWLRGK